MDSSKCGRERTSALRLMDVGGLVGVEWTVFCQEHFLDSRERFSEDLCDFTAGD